MLKQAFNEKYIAWYELNSATAKYVTAVRKGTLTEEIYETYQKANKRFTAAFNRLEKLQNRNTQRADYDIS